MADDLTSRNCLLVLLRATPALSMADRWPLGGFRVGGTTYVDVGLGDWTGFYDWLRRSDGAVVGVRYWPAIHNESLFDAARSLTYATIGSAGSLEIMFSPTDVIDAQRSGDQELLYDAVFRSREGEWAIAFDTTALRQSDLDRLRESNVAWHTSQASEDR